MKLLLSMLAFLFVGLILGGLGYGIFLSYQFLSMQWFSLNNDWKAILIIVAVLIVFSTLIGSVFIRSAIRNYGLNGSGKVLAYNDFIYWYSAFKNGYADAMNKDEFKSVANQMKLWGSKQVALQVNLLFELLQKEEINQDEVLKKGDHVYIEIRRDLGLRGTVKDNPIV